MNPHIKDTFTFIAGIIIGMLIIHALSTSTAHKKLDQIIQQQDQITAEQAAIHDDQILIFEELSAIHQDDFHSNE